VLSAFLTIAALGCLPHAHFKIRVRDTFFIQGPRTDAAISVVQNQAWAARSVLYCLALLALTPFLVRFTRDRSLLIPVVLLLALFAPLCWYYAQVSHVAMKLVDWTLLIGPTPDAATTGD